MKIVLTKDTSGIGLRGDIKNVKSGYFRNYLFPQGIAVVATPVRIKEAEARAGKRAIESERLIAEANDVVKKLSGLELTFVRKTSEKGKLYAALQEKDVIASILENANVKLEKEHLVMEHIKDEGEHEVTVKITDKAQAKIKVIVQREES